jgi:hypothetical protein
MTGGSKAEPINATIEDKAGKTKRVPKSELRPLATPRQTKFLPKEAPADNAIIMYQDGEHEIMVAKTITSTANKITVQPYRHNETVETWLPAWKTKTGKTKHKQEQPPESTPVTYDINPNQVMMVGSLTKGNKMSKDMKKQALARGYLATTVTDDQETRKKSTRRGKETAHQMTSKEQPTNTQIEVTLRDHQRPHRKAKTDRVSHPHEASHPATRAKTRQRSK